MQAPATLLMKEKAGDRSHWTRSNGGQTIGFFAYSLIGDWFVNGRYRPDRILVDTGGVNRKIGAADRRGVQ